MCVCVCKLSVCVYGLWVHVCGWWVHVCVGGCMCDCVCVCVGDGLVGACVSLYVCGVWVVGAYADKSCLVFVQSAWRWRVV